MTAGTNFSQSVKAPLWLTNGICKGNIPLVDRGYANGSQIVLVNPDKMWIYEQLTYFFVYISYWIYIYIIQWIFNMEISPVSTNSLKNLLEENLDIARFW